MNKENNTLSIDLHESATASSFLDNVKRFKASFDRYLSKEDEDKDLLSDLKQNLHRVLVQHQNIITRPTKLSPQEIQAEALLKEMIGRDPEVKQQGKLASLVAPLIKIFKGKTENLADKIFAQILANAKFNIPVLDRAKSETASNRKLLIERPDHHQKKTLDRSLK